MTTEIVNISDPVKKKQTKFLKIETGVYIPTGDISFMFSYPVKKSSLILKTLQSSTHNENVLYNCTNKKRSVIILKNGQICFSSITLITMVKWLFSKLPDTEFMQAKFGLVVNTENVIGIIENKTIAFNRMVRQRKENNMYLNLSKTNSAAYCFIMRNGFCVGAAGNPPVIKLEKELTED